MDEFFPSEIARLVLGYLKESKCENSWKVFLEECSSLHEYVELYNRGKTYPTNVNGKSLLDILKEYCKLKKDAESTCNNELSGNAFKEKCKMVLEDIVSNATEHIFLKYFPSIYGNNHHKGTSDMTESIDDLEGGKNSTEDRNTSGITKDVCLVTSENSTSDVTKSSELSAKNLIKCGNAGEKSKEGTNDDHTPENDSHDFDSNMKPNSTDPNTSQSCEHPGSGVNAVSAYLTETSVSNSMYLQEIIKVEKDDSFSVLENSPVTNICNVRSLAVNRNESSVISSKWHNLNSSKDNPKVLGENLSYVNSTPGHNKNPDKIGSEVTDSMEVEIIKTIKQEPDSNVNPTETKTTNTNCFQNSSIVPSQGSSSVEISQTSLHDTTQSTVGQFSNLVNNISISTNQSGYTLQTTPFSNQPIAVHDLSFPSVPIIMPNYSSSNPYMQNNAQFSFVINTSPQWKNPTVGGISLNLPSIHSNNIGPVLTSINSLASNSTPSVPTVCANNAFSPAMTAVDPVIRNTPSATKVSFNAIPNPALTTVNSTSVPSNVSSCVNTSSTVQAVLKSNLVTDSTKSKSNRLSKNKHTSDKMLKQKKNKNASLKEKEMPPSQLQSRVHPIIATRRRKGKKD